MKKTVFTAIVSAITFLLAVSPTNAAVSCQPIYGGGQSCVQTANLVIEKKVEDPTTGAFVDNLIGQNDPRFNPDQTINFQITVSNTGGQNIGKVTIQDIFSQFVTFIAGPGSMNGNTLSFDLSNLGPNETRTFNITGRIVPANQLPNGTICGEKEGAVNKAIAIADGQVEDKANFCIQNVVLAATPGQGKGAPAAPGVTKGGLKVFPSPKAVTTPPTGPEALALAALLPTGALGAFLRKLAGGR